MRKLFFLLICVTTLLSLTCCTNSTSSSSRVKLTDEQRQLLEDDFSVAMEEADFDWGDTPRHIPSLLAENNVFHLRMNNGPDPTLKALHFGPAPGEAALSIDNYEIKSASIFYGRSDTENDVFKSLPGVQKHIKNGVEWYFVSGTIESNLHVSWMCLLGEDSVFMSLVDISNETELTDKLAEKIMDDFLCIEF
jgi:hypothetical protein